MPSSIERPARQSEEVGLQNNRARFSRHLTM